MIVVKVRRSKSTKSKFNTDKPLNLYDTTRKSGKEKTPSREYKS